MVYVKQIVRQGAILFQSMDEFDSAAAAAEPAYANSNASTTKDLEGYLTSWGLRMYIEKLKQHSVDLETLQILSADDLKELVPVIGHRAKLTTQIAMLKNIISDAFTDQNTADEITDELYLLNDSFLLKSTNIQLLDDNGDQAEEQQTNDLTRQTNKDSELYKLLNSSNEGKGLLLQFQEKGLF